jgi:hypothetical protein
MKKGLIFCIIFIAISVFSKAQTVKFYLNDDSAKEYKIEDIRNLSFIKSNLSFSMTVFQKTSIKTNIDIREIDSIFFEGNQIMKIVQPGDLKTFNISSIDSIIFVSNAKKTASVTPNVASKTYGSPDPIFTGILTGFLPADGVTATYSRTAGETVAGSPYKISAVLSPAGVLSNYDITYNTADFTINKKTASVTPNVASKTYGSPDPTFTGTLTGFLPADGVTATYSRTAGETVAGSPYKISAVLSPAGVLTNYNITYNTADFTITEPSDTNNFQIEVTTTSSPQNFIVRFVNPGILHVDWGDGTFNDYSSTINATHTYATAGVYTVKMSGYVNLIDFFIYPDPGLGTPKLITAIKTPIRGITGLNSAYEMFKHCENIPSIPPGLFDQCPGITTFYDTFLACKRIKSIPPGLFDYQTNVVNFYATFDNCDSLTSIPPGLFDKHVNNTNFAWTFAKCYSLKSVPEGLFDKHTKVTTFSYVFLRCYALTSIPLHIFDKNTNVTNYSNAFSDCQNLTGESPTNSEGKKLWELTPTPNGTKCFMNCTKLSDYNIIPAGWK